MSHAPPGVVRRTRRLGNLEGESGLPPTAPTALPAALRAARSQWTPTSNLELSPALKYALVANPGAR